MDKNIFVKARECIGEGVIKKLFNCDKSQVYKRRELKILCPYRNDKHLGSFFINLDTGLWYDHVSTGQKDSGDLIDLIVRTFNISKMEAAEKIINCTGGVVPKKRAPEPEEEKAWKPIIPIPEDKLKLLNKHIKTSFIIEKYGDPISGWPMKMADGKPWMCIVRHIKGNKKKDMPYCFNDDNKWHAGWPLKNKCPLYGIEKLKDDSKILIVEGLKCANVEVLGYIVLSWHGGGNSIDKYDWSTIKNHDVIIWPDLDKKEFRDGGLLPVIQQPGMSTALNIHEKLNNSRVLDVHKKFGTAKPDGWDIFDAKQEGIDLVKFIEECKNYETDGKTYRKCDNEDDATRLQLHENDIAINKMQYNTNTEDNDVALQKTKKTQTVDFHEYPTSFQYLGFDDCKHYFIPNGSNIVKRISFGTFTKNKLFELAPLSYWNREYPQKTGFDVDSAIDDLIRQSEFRGYFKPDKVRGAGIWYDEDKIIVNNGDALFDEFGNELKDFKSKFFYVISDKDMGDFTGEVCTDEQGLQLMELFTAQGFEADTEAFIAMGWALVAPFGSLLKWRPHIWLTGPTSSGKSWILENLIHPLSGPFTFVGSGSDTAPGLYRALWRDPCPVIKDEMEPGKSKESQRKINDTIEVARNASGDFSSYKTIANQNGGVDRFCIRSCFCFSSVVPYMDGGPIENRILVCRIKNSDFTKNKYDKTKEILKTGIMDDPGIFRRKIFKNIRTFLKNVEFIRHHMFKKTGERRKSDNYAPIFAAILCIIRPGLLEDIETVNTYIDTMMIRIDKKETHSDEDILLQVIFDYNLRKKGGETISVAELIMFCENEPEVNSIESELLARNGIKVYNHKNRIKYLAIATNHTLIKSMLKDTMYSARYVNVLERHPAADEKIESKTGVYHRQSGFAGQKKYAVHLKWEEIRKVYFSDSKEVTTDLLLEVFDCL